MSNTKLYIPSRIKVGFQNRSDTYTNKLAYVIYFDEKNKLRKETSWEGWRDKKIDPIEFDNEPTEGFVLNKGVGGQRESWGWNARNEYIRVFDPRGFEFEISIANMLYILQECTSTKGKGLEGKFVYSWDGADLVLLPVDTFEYKQSSNFTENRGLKFTKKELKEGNSYLFKNMEEYLYLGTMDIEVSKYIKNPNYGKPTGDRYNSTEWNKRKETKAIEKRYVFYHIKNDRLYYLSSYTNVARLFTENHVQYGDASQKLYYENLSLLSFETTPKIVDLSKLKKDSYYDNALYVKANSGKIYKVYLTYDKNGTKRNYIWDKHKKYQPGWYIMNTDIYDVQFRNGFLHDHYYSGVEEFYKEFGVDYNKDDYYKRVPFDVFENHIISEELKVTYSDQTTAEKPISYLSTYHKKLTSL